MEPYIEGDIYQGSLGLGGDGSSRDFLSTAADSSFPTPSTLLKFSPHDAIFINQSSPEATFTIHNPSARFVWYKVLVKDPSVGVRAMLLGASPNGGVLKPFQSQAVRVGVGIAPHHLDGSSQATAEQFSAASEVCKLLVQARFAKKEGHGGDVDTLTRGDTMSSGWDFEEERSQDHVMEVHVLQQKQRTPPKVPLKTFTIKGIGGSKMASPNYLQGDADFRQQLPSPAAVGVLENIQELIQDNGSLRRHLGDLEQRHQSNVIALSQAKKEIDEAKMKSSLATRLVRQLEELKTSKESLEDEINIVKLQEMERQDRLVEADVLLQALRLENEEITRENYLLRQKEQKNCNSIERLKTSLDETKAKCEYLRESPVTKRHGYTAAEDLPRASVSRNLSSYFNNSRREAGPMASAGNWRERSMLQDSFSPQELSGTTARPFPPDSSPTAAILDKKQLFSCDDESLLFFLKSMTLFFAALTFLAAVNLVVADLSF